MTIIQGLIIDGMKKQIYEKYINAEAVVEEFTEEVIEIGNIILLRRPHSKCQTGSRKGGVCGREKQFIVQGGKMYTDVGKEDNEVLIDGES